MIITYTKPSSIRLQSGEQVVLVDPENNRAKGDLTLKTRASRADVLVETESVVSAGEFEKSGIEVVGVALPAGAESAGEIATGYQVFWEDLRLVFLQSIPADGGAHFTAPGEFAGCDILFISGGNNPGGVNAEEAARIARQIQPAVLIPLYTSGVERFLKQMGTPADVMEKFVFKKKDLVAAAMRLVVLESK